MADRYTFSFLDRYGDTGSTRIYGATDLAAVQIGQKLSELSNAKITGIFAATPVIVGTFLTDNPNATNTNVSTTRTKMYVVYEGDDPSAPTGKSQMTIALPAPKGTYFDKTIAQLNTDDFLKVPFGKMKTDSGVTVTRIVNMWVGRRG